MAQTYPKELIEIILSLDKKSSDQSEMIANKYKIKVVRGKKPGVAGTRMEGFKAATGDIIASTDADTQVSKNWISTIASTFTDHKEFVAITGPVNFYDGKMTTNLMSEVPYSLFQRFNLLIGLPSFPGFNFAVRKDAYLSIGGFNSDLRSSEDVDLSLRLKKVGKLAFIPEMKVYTSARRLEKQGWPKFLKHHLNNYVNFTILRQDPKGFENIR